MSWLPGQTILSGGVLWSCSSPARLLLISAGKSKGCQSNEITAQFSGSAADALPGPASISIRTFLLWQVPLRISRPVCASLISYCYCWMAGEDGGEKVWQIGGLAKFGAFCD